MSYENQFARIDRWLKGGGQTKAAAEDPGSTGTTHPSKSVDGGTRPAAEGSRSSENTSDVKAAIPASVDATGEGVNKNQTGGDSTPALDLGVGATATGEGKKTEVKTEKEDPGTSHPAKAGGEKYASLIAQGNELAAELTMAVTSFQQAEKQAAAAISAVPGGTPAPAAPAPAPTLKKKEGTKAADAEKSASTETPEAQAEAAGRQAADAVVDSVEKAAAATGKSAEAVISDIVKTASADAANLAEFMTGFKQGLNKSAEDMSAPGMDAGAGAGAETPVEEAMEPAPGAEAQGAGNAQAVQELIQALLSSGIPPEELIAMIKAAGGQGAAPSAAPELPPDGAGAPPVEPPVEPAAAAAEAGSAGKMASAREKFASLTQPEKVAAIRAALELVIGKQGGAK